MSNEHKDYSTAEGIAKFWMIITAIIVGVNLILILTLVQMAPKLKVIAQIATENPRESKDLLQMEPFSKNAGDKKLIDETLIRYYMDMRHTSFQDKDEMYRRWGNRGPVAQLSSISVYKRFSNGLKDKITAINSSNATTSVDILSISRMDNIFTIEFDLYHYSRGTIQSKRRVAIVSVKFNSARRFFRKSYSNPFGMYIDSYEETEKKK